MFYQYNYPLLNQTSTYWFHSHLLTQYVDGERGVLVVYDLDDPLGNSYDVDTDATIVTLADWYHEPAELFMDQCKLDGITPLPTSGLVNGFCRYIDGPEIPWSVINVVQGKRYLFGRSTDHISEHTFILKKNEVVQLNIHGSDRSINHPFVWYFELYHTG